MDNFTTPTPISRVTRRSPKHRPDRGRPAAPSPNTELEYQAHLREASDTTERRTRVAFADIAHHLSSYLIHRRQLPNMYFRQAAEEQRIPPEIYNRWNAPDWPNRFRNRTSDPHLTFIVSILLQVFHEIMTFPQEETYWDSMTLFRAQVNDLKADGIAHNRIAHVLSISNQTLQQLLNEDPNIKRRPRHCPWQLRATLTRRHKDFKLRITQSESDILNVEIDAERKADARLAIDPLTHRTYIAATSDPCTKCHQPPIGHNFHFNPDRTIERTCIYCGNNDFLDPQLAAQRRAVDPNQE